MSLQRLSFFPLRPSSYLTCLNSADHGRRLYLPRYEVTFRKKRIRKEENQSKYILVCLTCSCSTSNLYQKCERVIQLFADAFGKSGWKSLRTYYRGTFDHLQNGNNRWPGTASPSPHWESRKCNEKTRKVQPIIVIRKQRISPYPLNSIFSLIFNTIWITGHEFTFISCVVMHS